MCSFIVSFCCISCSCLLCACIRHYSVVSSSHTTLNTYFNWAGTIAFCFVWHVSSKSARCAEFCGLRLNACRNVSWGVRWVCLAVRIASVGCVTGHQFILRKRTHHTTHPNFLLQGYSCVSVCVKRFFLSVLCVVTHACNVCVRAADPTHRFLSWTHPAPPQLENIALYCSVLSECVWAYTSVNPDQPFRPKIYLYQLVCVCKRLKELLPLQHWNSFQRIQYMYSNLQGIYTNVCMSLKSPGKILDIYQVLKQTWMLFIFHFYLTCV